MFLTLPSKSRTLALARARHAVRSCTVTSWTCGTSLSLVTLCQLFETGNPDCKNACFYFITAHQGHSCSPHRSHCGVNFCLSLWKRPACTWLKGSSESYGVRSHLWLWGLHRWNVHTPRETQWAFPGSAPGSASKTPMWTHLLRSIIQPVYMDRYSHVVWVSRHM